MTVILNAVSSCVCVNSFGILLSEFSIVCVCLGCHDIENIAVRGNDISLCRKDLMIGADSASNILHFISSGG